MDYFLAIILTAVLLVAVYCSYYMYQRRGNDKTVQLGKKLTVFALVTVAGFLVITKMDALPISLGGADTAAVKEKTQAASQAIKKEGVQTATISVSASGYGAQDMELKSGSPLQINFKTEEGAGCLRQVISEELGLDAILEPGDNYIMIKDLKPGTYTYACGMEMYKGTITVK